MKTAEKLVKTEVRALKGTAKGRFRSIASTNRAGRASWPWPTAARGKC